MKRQPLSGLSKDLVLSFALISMALLLFACGSGDTGVAGPPGTSGTSSGTMSGTVKNSISGNPVAGVSVTTSPAVQGVTNITTDAGGNYSVSVPIGIYTLTFTKTNYTTQTTSTFTVVATQTTTKDINLVPTGSAVVNAGADQTGKAPGATVSLSASIEVYDPALTGTPTYTWTQTAGPTATISSPTSATTNITLPDLKTYKDKLVEAGGVYMGTKDANGKAIMEPLNRLMVQSIVPLSLEEAETATFKVTAAIGGRTFTDTVNVVASLPFFETLGIKNVPVGVPVILHGKTQGAYNWTVTTKPVGSQLTDVTDKASQNPHFTPDVTGKFTITEATLGAIDVFAGTWTGALSQFGVVDSACQGCHNGTTAPDKFTPWFASGHAEIFKNNFNLGSTGHYGEGCFLCHTVGWNPNATNNGFDDQATYAAFLNEFFPGGHSTGGSTNWSTITATGSTYGELVRRANIQCENCHGPQNSPAHNNAARISVSADVCGVCHGEPLRHARFQQWAGSGHGNFEVAIAEGISGGAVRTSCAGCHTGQGAIEWFEQLANVGGGRGVGSRTLDATSLAKLTGVNADNVHPQTCAVCHDPHAEGTTTGEPNNATVRVSGNTALLPGGFMANGVGRGAVCITCHNSRNGERTSGGGNPTLHEDGDTNFGTNTAYTTVSVGPYAGEHVAYAAPHEAAQGDVLMGRNAYFATGLRSRHSFIADTCTTCHMELTPPPAELSYNLAGTNHSFKASKTICSQCHGTYDGGTIQDAFDTKLAELATEITKAVYKLKNGKAAIPPATFVLSFGRSFRYSTDGGATYANVGSSYSISTGARTAGYLTDVTAGGTVAVDGYNAVIAKANWNYSLVSVDSSKGIHNPSFSFSVLDNTISQMKTLVASLP